MSTAVAGPPSTPATERPPGASHRRPRQYHGRHPRNPNPGPSADVPSTDGTLPQEDKQTPAQRAGGSQRKPREPSKHGASAPASGVSDRDKPARRSEGASTKPRRIPRRDDKPPASDGSNQGDSINRPRDTAKPPPPRNKRAARFNATLTEPSSDTGKSEKRTTKTERYARQPDKDDDLTTILTKTLSYAPYADCPICFASIHPAQPTWSCSPSSTAHVDADHENGAPHSENAQCCWTTFHLKCIRSWAEKSVKDVEAAWRDRGETRRGEWRCPGCQTKREVVPRMYWCFCGSTQDPKPPRLSTPHSCANPCTRPRVCGHPCPLACHPGPCPPCMVTTQLPCFCGKHSMSFLCSRSHPGRGKQAFDIINLSCGSKCGKALSCGNHVCQDICHDGECAPCSVREPARCWCGKEERELACGQGEEKESIVLRDGVEVQWVGKFGCENVCAEPYDCGVHTCPQSCHPPSRTPPPCPRSTSLITHCPCGKHLLSDPSSAAFFPPGAKLLRESCSDAVPTCKSLCMKPLDGCEHLCAVKCHTGDCPPCTIPIVRPCRCGSTTRQIPCHQSQEGVGTEEILCEKPCRALRNCGNHQCNRICCPLASLAGALKGKNKKRADATPASHDLVDEAGWHTCDLVCGKPLECGNHLCEERDHRGPCPTCLRSSFEEMVCHCGRTVLEPPIPCGTRINCSYPCSRAPPECGHPAMPHGCHEDDVSCPPCAFLTEKLCACGKKTVPNQRCSSQKVSCGTPCDKLLACGFHRCERLCHSGPCGSCTATCGKARKLCLPAQHACTHPCHAPSSCPETEPCTSLVTISCQCGRMRQSIQCGRCTTNQAGRQATQQLKCTTDCELAKRNARLAEALGISPDARKQEVVYPESVISFARANPKFVPVVEKAFFDFVTSDKKVQTLPHMPESRRRFVHDLAAIYRMDTQMVDQEPNRSVQLIRRVDTRLPTPLLSASLSSSSNALGKLTNLRATSNAWSRAQPALHAPAPALGTGRGWTSVAAKPVVSATRSSVVRTPPRPSSATLAGTTAATQPMPVRLGQVGAGPGLTSALPTSVSAAPPAAAVPEDVPDDWEDDA